MRIEIASTDQWADNRGKKINRYKILKHQIKEKRMKQPVGDGR